MTISLAVLASGTGSNFDAIQKNILAGTLDAKITVVLSNKEQAPVLTKAHDYQIPAVFVDAKSFHTHADYERALLRALKPYAVDVVVLAGYLKILGADFIDQVGCPIVNIHPSLLPAFPGLNAQKQAFDYGVKYTGVTVHFVDAGLDQGPIIAQRVVPVLPADTEETLKGRILAEEHKIYTEVLQGISEARYTLKGRHVMAKEI